MVEERERGAWQLREDALIRHRDAEIVKREESEARANAVRLEERETAEKEQREQASRSV